MSQYKVIYNKNVTNVVRPNSKGGSPVSGFSRESGFILFLTNLRERGAP